VLYTIESEGKSVKATGIHFYSR